MNLEFLLEMGCEEIPARHIDSLLEQLNHKFSNLLIDQHLTFEEIRTLATPRRLVVTIHQLSPFQPDRKETITGPPYSAAYNHEKAPTKAAEGFARKHNLEMTDLHCIETEKGQYLGFEKIIPGKETKEILGEAIPQLLPALELPKRMKWEPSQFLFVRPIRWLLCLLDGMVMPIKLAGIEASNQTHGHRILANNESTEVNNWEEYKENLLRLKVQVDPGKRLERIKSLLVALAANHGGKLIHDPDLLKTVVHLNEWPSVVCGNFNPAYMRLPREVLITVMREHQKYFSMQDDQGGLLPKFLAVVDSDEAYHPLITLGHERVIRARLADACFFWDTDVKVLLEDRIEKLKRITFQENLGTVYEKSRRIGLLAHFIAKSLDRDDLLGNLGLAARLCKADLTSEMVKEFTNLQGIMGGLYAKFQGQPEAVANAIYDHYRPTNLEDASPRSLEGAILSFADKMDSVVGAFSIGLIPSGSRDPLALRRQTLGLVKVLLDHRISISLTKIAHKAFSNLKRLPQRTFEDTLQEVKVFVKDRLKFIFKERGYRYDEINAIVEVDSDNPLDCLSRLNAISIMRASQDFHSLAISFKRIKNILAKAGLDKLDTFSVTPSLFEVEEESALFQRIELLRPRIKKARRTHQYQAAFELMASLRCQVDHFFDKVLVMAEDPQVQKNRLGLLGSLLQIFREVADISEIVVT